MTTASVLGWLGEADMDLEDGDLDAAGERIRNSERLDPTNALVRDRLERLKDRAL